MRPREILAIYQRNDNKTTVKRTFASAVFVFLLLVSQEAALSAETAVSGEEIFTRGRCSGCHTLGRGRFVGPDLLGVGERYSRDEIVKWARNPELVYGERKKKPLNEGYPPMPPMNLSEESARLVADYLLDYGVPEGFSEKGTIKGSVNNATSGEPQAGHDVALVSYTGEVSKDRRFAKADSLGRFSFPGLEWDRSYELTVFHDGVQYVSGKMVFPPGKDEITLDLPVYDTTGSDENISLRTLNVIVYPNDEGTAVNVTSLYDFRNSAETVFVGKPNASGLRTLEFSVPRNVEDVVFSGGVNPAELEREGEKAYHTVPFLPGGKKIALSYSIPASGFGGEFPIGLDYEAGDLAVFVRKTDLGVSVEDFGSEGESVVIHGEEFLKYRKSAASPPVAGFIATRRPFTKSTVGIYLPVILFFLAAGAGTAFFLYRRKESSAAV